MLPRWPRIHDISGRISAIHDLLVGTTVVDGVVDLPVAVAVGVRNATDAVDGIVQGHELIFKHGSDVDGEQNRQDKK